MTDNKDNIVYFPRYGDKSPRSFFGRLFGVFWILIGLVVITMFTATVTSALTHSSSPDFINALEGLKVSGVEQLLVIFRKIEVNRWKNPLGHFTWSYDICNFCYQYRPILHAHSLFLTILKYDDLLV